MGKLNARSLKSLEGVHPDLVRVVLKARERWTSVDSPAGELPALLPPGKQSAFDYRMGAIPKVGEHTEAILKELGVQR